MSRSEPTERASLKKALETLGDERNNKTVTIHPPRDRDLPKFPGSCPPPQILFIDQGPIFRAKLFRTNLGKSLFLIYGR